MKTISSFSQVLNALPRYTQLNSGEIKAPCPFCTSGAPHYVQDGIDFYGEDRLVIFSHHRSVYCRYCAADNRGRNGRGSYSMAQFIARLNGVVADGFVLEEDSVREEKPLTSLWTDYQVELAHAKVNESYWKSRGIFKDAIKKFRLGAGRLYSWNIGDGHLIPMKVRKYGEEPDDLYYMAYRGIDADGKSVKIHTPGSSHEYVAYVFDEPTSKTCAVTEGEIDFVTANALGYKNVISVFGATNWTVSKLQMLISLGFRHLVLLVDGGAAGSALRDAIIHDCHRFGVTVEYVDWHGEDTDLNEVHCKFMDYDQTRKWLEVNIVDAPAPEGAIKPLNIGRENQTDERKIVSIADLRGRGPDSIRRKLDMFTAGYDYNNRGKGEMLIIAAGAGSGKTHTTVEKAQEIAVEHMKWVHKQRERMQAELDEIEGLNSDDYETQIEAEDAYKKLKRSIDNLDVTAVDWYSQYRDGFDDILNAGADPSLWFNFDARNAENCQNIGIVNALGANNHDIGMYCRRSCPFFKECNESGYLAQEKRSKESPIVFYRHQHLQASMVSKRRQLVVVDENSASILENNPVSFDVEDVRPAVDGWQFDIDVSDLSDAIEKFSEAIRATMSFNAGLHPKLPNNERNPLYVLSGRSFMYKLDEHVRTLTGMSLKRLIERIDGRILASTYQPNFNGTTIEEIRMRCIPQLFTVIKRELADYTDTTVDYPSCIHLIAGRLEIYAPKPIAVRHRNPLVILDATPLEDLYYAMFRRNAIVYKPSIKNDNAKTIVVSGSDWTNTEIYKAIGRQVADRKRLIEKTYETLDGSTFDPTSVPVSDDLYDSKIVKHAVQLVKGLATKHKSLLVITHKHFREVVEAIFRDKNPEASIAEAMKNCDLQFGHYGALRGTNRYEDFEAVALIGAFRIPYDIAWRRISMWAWLLGIREHISPDTITQESFYDYQDENGVMELATYRTFDHPFADRYVNFLETGELEQCANRIRPHSSDAEKYIYMVASRPALPFVDLIRTKTDVLQDFGFGKFGDVYEEVEKYYLEHGKMPKYEVISAKFGVSNREIAKVRKMVQQKHAG